MNRTVTFLLLLPLLLLCNCKQEDNAGLPGIPEQDIVILHTEQKEDKVLILQEIEKSVVVNTHASQSVCAEISEMYYAMETYSLGTVSVTEWKEKNRIIAEALLAFFKTEKSLSVNIEAELSFLSYAVSNDGLIRIYTWDKKEGGRSFSNNAVIQYITTSGKPDVILMEDFVYEHAKSTIQPDLLAKELYYTNIYLLDNNTYLLEGYVGVDLSTVFHGYFAIRLQDDVVLPYAAFHNKATLLYHERFSESEKYGIEKTETFFEKKPYTIEIVFREQQKNNETVLKSVQFVFNDGQFMGDYELFNAINNR
jgi:hypothetical protein